MRIRFVSYSKSFALLSWLGAAIGCNNEAKSPAPPQATAGTSSPIERYFPLEEGKIYHYVTKDGPDTGMLVAKVRRTDAAHGELQLSNATKRFFLSSDGVAYVGGAFLLKTPLEPGASWPGEHGGITKITTVDATVEVPAGHYSSCLQTVEENTRLAGAKYETTYCPGIGMVRLIVTAKGAEGRAELKSYGLPVKIE